MLLAKKLKMALVGVLALTLSACASLSTPDDKLQLPIMYGTLKVIERDNGVSSEDVLKIANSLQSIIDSEDVISSSLIKEYIHSQEGYQNLSVSDRFLIDTIFASVEESINERIRAGDLLQDDVKERVGTLVGYVSDAAMMSQ